MVMIPLNSGAYSSESYIANSQRSVNLYSEKNPEETDPKFPVTQYVRPGYLPLSVPPQAGAGRLLYGATNGDAYAVVGQQVFYIDPNFKFTSLGAVITNVGTPASMAD